MGCVRQGLINFSMHNLFDADEESNLQSPGQRDQVSRPHDLVFSPALGAINFLFDLLCVARLYRVSNFEIFLTVAAFDSHFGYLLTSLSHSSAAFRHQIVG